MKRLCESCNRSFSCHQNFHRHKKYYCRYDGETYHLGIDTIPLETVVDTAYPDSQLIQCKAQFKHPCTITIAGPTKAGKSTLVRQTVNNVSKFFSTAPETIVWGKASFYQKTIYKAFNL